MFNVWYNLKQTHCSHETFEFILKYQMLINFCLLKMFKYLYKSPNNTYLSRERLRGRGQASLIVPSSWSKGGGFLGARTAPITK